MLKKITDFTIKDAIIIQNEEELHLAADHLDRLRIYSKRGYSFRNVPKIEEFLSLYGSLYLFPRTGEIGSPQHSNAEFYYLTEIDFLEGQDHYTKRVEEFQKAFRSPVLNSPKIPSEERCRLRVSLLREELEELEEAIEDGDLVACADALTDLLVVLEETFIEFGLQSLKKKLFDEVMDSNMSKLDSKGRPIINGENGVLDATRPLGKILKSENFFEPNLKQIILNKD